MIITILWKHLLKYAVERAEEKFEITAIPIKYNDTLDDLIDSSDTKSPG